MPQSQHPYPPQPQNQQPYPPQQQNQQPFYPPQQQNPHMESFPQIQRANTYYQQPPKRQTIYDTLDVKPHRFAPESQRQINNFSNTSFGRPSNPNQMNNNLNNQLSSSYYNNFPAGPNFNPEEDCKVLRNAVHGWGTG